MEPGGRDGHVLEQEGRGVGGGGGSPRSGGCEKNETTAEVVNAASTLGITTRRNSTLSSKVNLPHAINFTAKCGANRVTHPSDI